MKSGGDKYVTVKLTIQGGHGIGGGGGGHGIRGGHIDGGHGIGSGHGVGMGHAAHGEHPQGALDVNSNTPTNAKNRIKQADMLKEKNPSDGCQ